MSCSLCSEEELFMIRQNSLTLSHSMSVESKKGNPEVIKLPRGGYVVQTKSIGNIQFGIPPESVKDSLILGIDIPTYYIVPQKMFDKGFGLTVAEFEFPAYFNFFVKKTRIVLICTKESMQAIRAIFQETLLGPKSFETLSEDFDEDFPVEKRPDLQKELSNFAKNPFNPSEPLLVETLLDFILFDENGFAYLPHNVVVRKDSKRIAILENEQELASFKDSVMIKMKDENSDYKDTFRYGLFLNPCIEIDQKKIAVYKESYKPINFEPPMFGLSVLGSSHGFDPHGSNSGYIIWINGRGIMVDPPPFTTHTLKKLGIPSILIEWIIITHCHADHDAGAFQKILESSRVEIITTKTILGSFVRKYSAIKQMKESELTKLFKFRPAVIGTPLRLNGGVFNFFYSLHTIPCIGFSVHYEEKSIYFSGDTFYDPEGMKKLVERGVLSQGRYEALISGKWNHDVILHEAGVPPIHTPMAVLNALPEDVKSRLYLVHVAQKDIPFGSGLKMASTGIENTLSLTINSNNHHDTLRKLDIISSIEIFEKSSARHVRDLLESAAEIKYKANQMICEEGEKSREFFIIIKGIVKIYSETAGKEFERFCHVGDYFGESAIKSSPRMANAIAHTDVELLAIKKNEFVFIFGDNSEITNSLLQLRESRRSKSLNIICKNSFFSHLTSSQKIKLEMILNEKKVSKGEVLWKIGDPATFAFLLSTGEVEFFSCKEAEIKESSLTVGAFFGEIDCIINDKPLTTNLRANSDCEIYEIEKEELIGFLKNNPGLLLLLGKAKFIP